MIKSLLINFFTGLKDNLAVLKKSVLYFFAVGVNKGMPFLLVPLLTRYLTVEEFGFLGIATVVVGLLTIFVGLNPSLYIIRNFCRLDHEGMAGFVYQGLIAIAVMLAFSVIVLWGFSETIFMRYELGLDILLALAGTAALMASASLVLTVLQMEKNALLFLKFSIVGAVLQLLFVLFLVVFVDGGWKGKVVGDLAAAVIFTTALLYYLKKRDYIAGGFSGEKMKKLLAFSLPLLPHVLSIWGMNFVDRFFLAKMVSMESVGLYSAAYTLGMGTMLIHASLQRAWQPYFFEGLLKDDPAFKVRIVKYTWLYYIGSIVLFILYVEFIFLIMPYIVGSDFQSSFEYIPMIVLGYTFLGMYTLVAGYLYHVNRTVLLASVSVAALILNMILNYLFISYNGAIGAAQATTLTFLFLFLVVKILAIKCHDMPWFSFKAVKGAKDK